MTSQFEEMLTARFAAGAHLCVGLDPKPSDVEGLTPTGIKIWLMNIVKATAPYAAAYKPNLQFYLRWGWRGVKILEELNDWMGHNFGEIPRILDAKWGDIGDTNLGSLDFAMSLDVQAVTIHNYMGVEAMDPLLRKFYCFVLCKTSNSGSGEFQDLELRGGENWRTTPLYRAVAKHVETTWNGDIDPGAGLVVGATHPRQLAEIDQAVKGLVFLIPGVGKQGGSVEAAVRAVQQNTALINVSSGITSAPDPAKAAEGFNEQIREALAT